MEKSPLIKDKLLIVSATKEEVLPLALYSGHELVNGLNTLTGIDILITGVGMVNTAFHLGEVLATNHYRYLINAGIAGSFSVRLNLGDVVNVISDQFTELGAENGDEFIEGHKLNFIETNGFINQGIIFNNSLQPIIFTLPEVDGITVNKVHGNEESIAKVISKFNPTIESMEGAAFLYCCLKKNQPCIQIRAISNYVSRRDRSSWQIGLAISQLNAVLIKLIKDLN